MCGIIMESNIQKLSRNYLDQLIITMTILILIVLLAFGIFFYFNNKKKYISESDPILKKKMIRRGFWIGFTPLILVILYGLGWIVYFWTHVSGDL